MATIKSFTSLEQSRKLAEILPLESSDMFIGNYVGKSGKVDGTNIHYYTKGESFGAPEIIPAWSLASLLGVFPYYEINNNGVNIQLSVKGEALITEKEEELLDLVVNMIIHLHKLKML